MTIHDYLELEKQLPQLDDIEVNCLPVWRIVRTKFRWSMINGRPFTVSKNYQLGVQLRNNHRSFMGLTKLMLSKRRVKTIFFPHPRLFLVDGNSALGDHLSGDRHVVESDLKYTSALTG